MGGTTEAIPFWLVSSFEYEYIDERIGDVSFKIFTKWWWHSKEKLEIKKNEGHGTFFANEAESAYFPVNPSLPFLNLILIDNIDQLAWAKSTELKAPTAAGNKFLNSAQKVYRAKLRSKLEMKCYPFDRHIVPAILAVRQWRVNKELKHKWQLESKKPNEEWFNGAPSYDEDDFTVNLIDTWTDRWDELKKLYYPPEVRILKEGKGKPVLCLKLERDPSSFILNVVFPTFITVSIVLMSCYSPDGPSIESVATGVLTLVASQLALQEKLPKKVYITYAGIYLLSAYTFMFGLGIALTIMGRNGINNILNNHNAGFWIILIFAIFWGVLHLFILLDDLILQTKFMRRTFRVSWEDIEIPEQDIKNGELEHKKVPKKSK
jgi:hypothetical protein